MPGRPDFSQPGSRGSGQVVATTSRPEVEEIDVSQTGSVAAGTTEITEVYAPAGAIYKVMSLQISVLAPSNDGATTGTHLATINPLNSMATIAGESNHNSNLIFTRSYWKSADAGSEPPDNAAAVSALTSLRATENSPLAFNYNNSTDSATSQNRTLKMVVEEASY